MTLSSEPDEATTQRLAAILDARDAAYQSGANPPPEEAYAAYEQPPFVYPQPGERRNASAIPVTDADLATLLLGTRLQRFALPQGVDPTVEADLDRLWDTYLPRLSAATRATVEGVLAMSLPLLAGAAAAEEAAALRQWRPRRGN